MSRYINRGKQEGLVRVEQAFTLGSRTNIKKMRIPTKVLLMENVRNIVSEKHMADFQDWIKELERLGYSNYWEILNLKITEYSNRERVFMVYLR